MVFSPFFFFTLPTLKLTFEKTDIVMEMSQFDVVKTTKIWISRTPSSKFYLGVEQTA